MNGSSVYLCIVNQIKEYMMDLENLLELFSNLDKNINKEFEINGKKICIDKEDNCISISVETIDDTVELCEEFKESLEDLDDCLFQEIFENLEDNKEFDRLLNLDKFTKEESIKVRKMINVASKHIAQKLRQRISEYQELYAVFQDFQ